MMEFTLSRVCMSLCGFMLLAAVIVPVTGMYESDTVGMESRIPESVASLINDFYFSKIDSLTVPMSDILPDAASYIGFGENMITLTTERGIYMTGTNVPTVSDGVFGYGDILRLSRSGGSVVAERVML